MSQKEVQIFGYADQTWPIPFANLVPASSKERIDALRQSIKDFGIRSKIIVRKGDRAIISGHNRLLLAAELELPIEQIPFEEQEFADDETAADVVVSLNAAARDNSDNYREDQSVLLRMEHKWSARRIAKVLGVSHVTIAKYLNAAAAKAPPPAVVVTPEGETVPTVAEETPVVGKDGRTQKPASAKRKAAAKNKKGVMAPPPPPDAVPEDPEAAKVYREGQIKSAKDSLGRLTRHLNNLGVFKRAKSLLDQLTHFTNRLKP